MDKQYYVLTNHKDKNISWTKGEIILLDPDLAVPYIGKILTPLYTAIKSGIYQPNEPKLPLVAQIIEDVKEAISPDPKVEPAKFVPQDSNDVVKSEPSKKKLLQNKLQAQIMAKKAELANQKA